MSKNEDNDAKPGLRMASGGTESDTGAIARSLQEFVDQFLRKEIQ